MHEYSFWKTWTYSYALFFIPVTLNRLQYRDIFLSLHDVEMQTYSTAVHYEDNTNIYVKYKNNI